jgi:hypothetical protein
MPVPHQVTADNIGDRRIIIDDDDPAGQIAIAHL